MDKQDISVSVTSSEEKIKIFEEILELMRINKNLVNSKPKKEHPDNILHNKKIVENREALQKASDAFFLL